MRGPLAGRERRVRKASLRLALGVLLTPLAMAVGCGQEMDTAERVEMPDSMPIVRALENMPARDSMLDSLPGGEMARGDPGAEERLLRTKMPGGR